MKRESTALLILIILTLMIAFSGCSRKLVVTNTDETLIETKDTTIIVPKEEVSTPAFAPVFTSPYVLRDTVIVEKKGRTTVKLQIKDNYITAECETDSLKFVIENLRKEVRTKTSVISQLEKSETKGRNTVINNILLIVCIVAGAYVIGQLVKLKTGS